MKTATNYPFQLSNYFFKSIEISRIGQLPESISLDLNTQIRIREQDHPDRLQVDFRLLTDESQPLDINIEMVGLFNLIEGEAEQEQELIRSFVLDRGLFMLWSIMSQMVKQVTSQMGMSPLNVAIPPEFFFHLEQPGLEEEE